MSEPGPDDLPLLGEPLPVELANTWYVGEGGQVTDFLGSPARVRLWFGTASVAAGLALPPALDEREVAAVRALRDAVRSLLEAMVTGAIPPEAAIDTVNRCAVPSRPVLRWTADDGPSRAEIHDGGPMDVLLGHLATATIAFATSGAVSRLRRCTGPGCAMLYVQEHYRRRWCHESCGHRARQARYYRRKTAISAGGPR